METGDLLLRKFDLRFVMGIKIDSGLAKWLVRALS
jgi:hypothetical protein